MSFLNPVSEPVLRFSSTDVGAPQINYNARVAGDVKTVLKGCLVTGYGAKPSAEWSIVNEADHVAEFVSPSAAMSDYRLGIDDTSTSSTTWYYQYQNARVNPANSAPTKNIQLINKNNPSNGWELLVTNQGIYFIELVYNDVVNSLVARVTFWGQTKVMIPQTTSNNIGFWIVGVSAPSSTVIAFFNFLDKNNKFYRIDSYSSINFASLNIQAFSKNTDWFGSTVEVDAGLYLESSNRLIAEQPGVVLRNVNDESKLLGAYQTTVGDRPALYISVTDAGNNSIYIKPFTKGLVFALDYWEY